MCIPNHFANLLKNSKVIDNVKHLSIVKSHSDKRSLQVRLPRVSYFEIHAEYAKKKNRLATPSKTFGHLEYVMHNFELAEMAYR